MKDEKDTTSEASLFNWTQGGQCETNKSHHAGTADQNAGSSRQKRQKICRIENCAGRWTRTGLCRKHQTRLDKFGSTDKPKHRDTRGKLNSNWKGGTTIAPDGRVLVFSPEHPHPNWKNYVYRYRLTMEAHIGRFLKPEEHVHHINEDPTDDRIENLQIMSESEHHAHHGDTCRRFGLWALKHTQCVKCGTSAIGHKAKGKCFKCYEEDRPSRVNHHE